MNQKRFRRYWCSYCDETFRSFLDMSRHEYMVHCRMPLEQKERSTTPDLIEMLKPGYNDPYMNRTFFIDADDERSA
jgi:hypothetical protein